ncbi:hypothetical protein HAX54_005014, partial [Datura stramonium]|nr:hypothetical protein [Datura stramonium]
NIILEISPTMALKASTGKGVTSSSHGSKRSRRVNEEQNEDASIPSLPLRHFGLCWIT